MELLTDKVIYHVETQEDYDDLIEKLKKLGCRWVYAATCTWVNHFPKYGENTAIRIGNKYMFYTTLSYYLNELNTTYKDHHIIKYKREQNSMKVKLKAEQKFIADWYEEHKGSLQGNLYFAFLDISTMYVSENMNQNKFYKWLSENDDCVETLVKMHLFGYEIEQVPLYYVELPNPNYESKVKKYYLARTVDGRIVIQSGNTAEIKENWKLTELEIKKDFEWAWDFAREV